MSEFGDLTIRPLNNFEEYEAVIDLQREVWQCDDIELTPPDLLKMHGELGGVVLAAWEPSGRPVAFVYSLLGIKDGQMRHWSRMLGVLPEYRDRGLGRLLKWKQRDAILAQGIHLCRWTYDPLETRNAYLNIVKLGAVSFEYHPNVYGNARNELDSGLPTDRLIANWQLDSERVEAAFQGKPERSDADINSLASAIEHSMEDGLPIVKGVRADLKNTMVYFPVPANFQSLKAKNIDAASEWRMAVREACMLLFDNGYVLTDVLPPEKASDPVVNFVLEKDE